MVYCPKLQVRQALNLFKTQGIRAGSVVLLFFGNLDCDAKKKKITKANQTPQNFGEIFFESQITLHPVVFGFEVGFEGLKGTGDDVTCGHVQNSLMMNETNNHNPL